MITAASNAQIKNIGALLKKSKERREQKSFVVEGKRMFEEALLRRNLLRKAFFSESYASEFYPDGIPKDIPHEVVADRVFSQMSETVTPQGVLAIVAMPEHSFGQLIVSVQEAAQKTVQGQTLVLLEDIRDPGNLGTILRTAEAAGVAGVLLTEESVDVYNPKVVRSTMGAVFRVPVFYVEDFIGLLAMLKGLGVRLLAAHLGGTKPFMEAEYGGCCGILIGNEANGLSERATALATEKVIIPMAGEAESLNAAVAASLLMYEAFRRRIKTP